MSGPPDPAPADVPPAAPPTAGTPPPGVPLVPPPIFHAAEVKQFKEAILELLDRGQGAWRRAPCAHVTSRVHMS